MLILNNTIDISNKCTGATITKAVNTGYDTATVSSSIQLATLSTLSIDSLFDGFVYSCVKNGRASYNVECRSNTAKITTPFQSESVSVIEEATTSHTLCAQYASKYGFPIINECENLDFGGGYERTGTVLSALVNVANVTGAEYYPFGTGLKLTPNRGITKTNPKVLLASEVHDFMPISKTIENQGIRYIIIGTVATVDPDAVTTSFKCDATVDPCNGLTMVNIVPASSFSSAVGISLSPINSQLIYDGVIAPTYTLQLATEIASITSIYIGGVPVSGYSFILDTIVFTAEQQGIAYITYIGKQFTGYANIVYVSGKRYTEFSIYYGNCDRYAYQSVLDCNGDGGDGNNDGGGGGSDNYGNGDDNEYRQCEESYIITPRTKNYVAGFPLTVIATAAPSFIFYSNEAIYGYTPIPNHSQQTWVEKCMLSQEGAVWKHTLAFETSTVNEVRSAGGTVPTANYSIAGKVISFNQYYPDAVISYQVSTYYYFIQFPNEEGKNVKMIVEMCSYELEGLDYDSTSSSVCAEGISIPIDLIKELGATPMQAASKSISMVDPLGAVSTITSDKFGIVRIVDSIFGKYVLNTGNVIKHSSLTVSVGSS